MVELVPRRAARGAAGLPGLSPVLPVVPRLASVPGLPGVPDDPSSAEPASAEPLLAPGASNPGAAAELTVTVPRSKVSTCLLGTASGRFEVNDDGSAAADWLAALSRVVRLMAIFKPSRVRLAEGPSPCRWDW